jgi:hypothetical protein
MQSVDEQEEETHRVNQRQGAKLVKKTADKESMRRMKGADKESKRSGWGRCGSKRE